MSLSAEDRVALLLGRAIHRAEALQVRNEQLEDELAALREELSNAQNPGSETAAEKATLPE